MSILDAKVPRCCAITFLLLIITTPLVTCDDLRAVIGDTDEPLPVPVVEEVTQEIRSVFDEIASNHAPPSAYQDIPVQDTQNDVTQENDEESGETIEEIQSNTAELFMQRTSDIQPTQEVMTLEELFNTNSTATESEESNTEEESDEVVEAPAPVAPVISDSAPVDGEMGLLTDENGFTYIGRVPQAPPPVPAAAVQAREAAELLAASNTAQEIGDGLMQDENGFTYMPTKASLDQASEQPADESHDHTPNPEVEVESTPPTEQADELVEPGRAVLFTTRTKEKAQQLPGLNAEAEMIHDQLMGRLSHLQLHGAVFNDADAAMYDYTEADTPSAIQYTRESRSHVFPRVHILSAPDTGTLALFDCITAGLFDKDLSCLDTHEPCGQSYLWTAEEDDSDPVAFYRDPIDGSSSTTNYADYFPIRNADTEHATTIDTVTHLSHPSLFMHMYATSPMPRDLRFVVMLRNPMDRAYTEWFRLHEDAEDELDELDQDDEQLARKATNLSFGEKVTQEMDELRWCWPDVEDNPYGVLELPYTKFFAKYQECFSYRADNHVRNSLYVIALRNWLQFFDLTQFKFTAEASRLASVVNELTGFAKFAGLHMNAEILQQLTSIEGDPPNRDASKAEDVVQEKLRHVYTECRNPDSLQTDAIPAGPATTRLRSLLQPYNDALSALVPALKSL